MLKRLKRALQIPISLLVAYSFSSITLADSLATTQLTTLITSTSSQPHYVQLDGRVEAIKQGTISAQTSGVVEAVHVDVNDSVNAGQILVIINNTQQSAQLSQAQANLAQAKALDEDAQVLLRRNRSLFAKKTLSQGELDSTIARAKSSKAAALAAQASVKQAEEQLSYTRIKAPYSGIVSQRMVQVGELVNPGQALMSGFAPQPLRVITDIPQHLVAQLNISPEQAIKIQAAGNTLSTAQFTLFPYADSRYSSVRARIDLMHDDNNTDQALMPGSWVEVLLPIGEHKGIYLPRSALLQQGEVASIYIKDSTTGRFKQRYIRRGQINKQTSQIEIIAGLSPNEEVAIDALAAAQQIRSSLNISSEQ